MSKLRWVAASWQAVIALCPRVRSLLRARAVSSRTTLPILNNVLLQTSPQGVQLMSPSRISRTSQ